MTTNVLHLIDSLTPGGAERVAVALSNGLLNSAYRPHLVATRRGGALAAEIDSQVRFLNLHRRHRFDLQALQTLVNYVRANKIGLLHAHSSSVFIASLAGMFCPRARVIWHVHQGALADKTQSLWLYQLVARRIQGVLTVTEALRYWVCKFLGFDSRYVWYLPNMLNPGLSIALPQGIESNKTVVCVANLRPEKDHLTLLAAWRLVVREQPQRTLLLIGAAIDPGYLELIQRRMREPDLRGRVVWLGGRSDVMTVLRRCQVGVMSSITEGFPLVLLEYGAARLGVVATTVGQCAEILDQGLAGLLVPARNPPALAEAILKLLNNPSLCHTLGQRLAERTVSEYSAATIIGQLVNAYERVLEN